MSGTAGGTIVLHVAPESEDPSSVFGIVEDGDVITCDVESRSLRVELSDEEIQSRIARRRQAAEAEAEAARSGLGEAERTASHWVARENMRGYRGLYMRSVNQADEGADFDFLTAAGPGRRS
ncbi:dihydroxy-acid/6-phosphogluconate dehydratase [Apiospora marii]